MLIEFTDSEVTDLLIFLGMAEEQVKAMSLLPEDEHLRLAMQEHLKMLLTKFER